MNKIPQKTILKIISLGSRILNTNILMKNLNKSNMRTQLLKIMYIMKQTKNILQKIILKIVSLGLRMLNMNTLAKNLNKFNKITHMLTIDEVFGWWRALNDYWCLRGSPQSVSTLGFFLWWCFWVVVGRTSSLIKDNAQLSFRLWALFFPSLTDMFKVRPINVIRQWGRLI